MQFKLQIHFALELLAHDLIAIRKLSKILVVNFVQRHIMQCVFNSQVT